MKIAKLVISSTVFPFGILFGCISGRSKIVALVGNRYRNPGDSCCGLGVAPPDAMRAS